MNHGSLNFIIVNGFGEGREPPSGQGSDISDNTNCVILLNVLQNLFWPNTSLLLRKNIYITFSRFWCMALLCFLIILEWHHLYHAYLYINTNYHISYMHSSIVYVSFELTVNAETTKQIWWQIAVVNMTWSNQMIWVY